MPVPPVSGEAYTFFTTLTSQANVNIFQVNPTLAVGDVQVSIDGGALNNITTLPVVTPAGGKQVQVDLSIAEMTGDAIGVIFSDVAGAEWQDRYIEIRTDSQEIGDIPTAAQNADAVWDEVLTVGTHDVGYSAGQRLRYLILDGNVATAGAANTITLAGTASATDDLYSENIISIVAGAGAGQTRLIADYDGGTKVATVDRAWTINPAAGSVYEILPFSSILLSDHGLALGGSSTTIELAATASAVDDIYIGSVVFISSGTGVGQVRLITDYVGATQIATVSDAWTVTPDVTSVYKVLPVGRVIAESCPGTTLGSGANTWTYTLTSTVAPNPPIADADVWVTTDVAGTNVVASGRTDAAGVVTFYLDAGTIYVWRQKSGWDFTNPDTEVVP